MGSPAAVGAGVVCRVKIAGGSISYTTRRMTLEGATAVRDDFRAGIGEAIASRAAFVQFPSAHHEIVDIRVDKVSVVEVVRVDGSVYAGGVTQP